MAVESTEVPLGTSAPDFRLTSIDGQAVGLADLEGQALVVVFACNHCPYVKHVENELGKVAAEYASRDVAMVAICSNDVGEYPDDKPERLREQRDRANWNFPYLVDESQDVGQAYGAVCTPDLFVYDTDRKLAYRGAFDSTTPSSGGRATGELLRGALEKVLAGESVPTPHRPALGCSIKWRKSA